MFTFSPDLMREGLQTFLLQRMIANEPNIVPVLCVVINSTKNQEEIPLLGDVPQLKPWLGNRKITRLTHAKTTVKPAHYEASMAFERDHFADDQYGVLGSLLNQMAIRAAHHPIKLVSELLESNGVCYDGAQYFSNTHPARGEQTAAQDNLGAGTSTAVAGLQTDIALVKTWFRRVVDEANEPFFETAENLLVIAPPELEQAFIQVLFLQTLSTGGQNSYAGMADLWINHRLVDPNDWYVFNLDMGMKPMVFVNREGINISTKGLDPTVWSNTREVVVGVDVRYGVGYLMWQCGYKFVN